MNLLQSGICNIILTAGTGIDFTASLNTILAVGVAIIVLILISILFYVSKVLPDKVVKLLNENNLKGSNSSSLNNSSNQVVMSGDLRKEYIDDSELVAVITAAIMASMGDEAPADGLVVKSIRKANGKQWKNA